jgi:hypothetical protein
MQAPTVSHVALPLPMSTYLIYCAAVLVCLVVGYSLGRSSHQNVNDLISVGYTVTDPDGYQCERWDEGIAIDRGYWTTTPK